MPMTKQCNYVSEISFNYKHTLFPKQDEIWFSTLYLKISRKIKDFRGQ